MMTKKLAIDQMLRWLDEATANGQAVPADQIADLKDRAAYLLDGVVKFLAGQFKIPAVHSVVRTPVENLLGQGFPIFSGYPPDTYSATAVGGKSFYIEVSGSVTVTVFWDGGSAEYEISGTDGGFQVVRGNIPNAGEGEVQIEVNSDYPFSVRNAAVYPCSFASDDDVQEYIPYVPYELPDDFREFDTLLQTSDRHTYRRFSDYRKEGLKTFLLPYDATGQFDFRYFRNPADVPVDAPDTAVLEIAQHAEQLVPLKLAVDCCMGVEDTMTIGYYLNGQFNNTLMNLLTGETGEMTVIEAVYSME